MVSVPNLRAPIDVDMNSLKGLYNKAGYTKNGNLNHKELIHLSQYDKDYWKYYDVVKVMEIYRACLSVEQNPNKLLKLALEYREANKDKLDMFKKDYIGLDRIGWFFNLNQFFNRFPIQKNENNNKLQFDKAVLIKLLKQFNEKAKAVTDMIGKDNIWAYKLRLDDCNRKYQEYKNKVYSESESQLAKLQQEWNSNLSLKWKHSRFYNYVINARSGKAPLFNCLTFYEYMIYPARYIKPKELTPEDYRLEVTKLLRLDGVLRCKKEIDKFITDNSLGLEELTLNWFQKKWNSLVRGTFIAELGLFFSPLSKIKSYGLIDNVFKPCEDTILLPDDEK